MKKLINTIKILAIGSLLVGCSTTDMNEDPNSAYTAVPSTLLTYAEKSLADYLNTPSVNTNNFRLVLQYWQEVTYVDESNYDFVTRNISNTVWSVNYVDVLQNLNQAKSIINGYQPTAAEAVAWPAQKKNQLAIIDLLQVFVYQDLVNTYGDIPYTSSNNVDSTPLPTYQKAADIYSDLINRTKTDLSNLDVNEGTFDSGEVFYNGSISKWTKFGNSLLLKLGITLSDVNPTLAQSTVNEAIAGGVFTSAADDALIQYYSAAPNYNQLYANLVASNRNDFVAGKTLVDYMNGSSDARRASYFGDNKTPYVGGTIGSPSSFSSFSHIGEFAYTQTTPGILLNYTEVAFYLAEAASRWGIGGDAATAYANAVTASFKQWGLTDADATAYLLTKPYSVTDWKKSLGEQAWVAMFNQGNTGWGFWRRLDYPVLVAPSTAVSQAESKVPVRLQYPVRESSTNPTNYAAASASIGGDKLTTKLFWDIH